MMQKEEKIVMVLLIMAVLSLIVGYFGFSSQTAIYSADSKVGDHIFVEGTILNKQMTGKGDNLILTISDLDIKVFIPKDNGAKEVYSAMKTGTRVRINGKVSEFNQKKEILVENVKNIIQI